MPVLRGDRVVAGDARKVSQVLEERLERLVGTLSLSRRLPALAIACWREGAALFRVSAQLREFPAQDERVRSFVEDEKG